MFSGEGGGQMSKCSLGKEKDRWQTDPIAPPGRLKIADGNDNVERAGDEKVVHLKTDWVPWADGTLGTCWLRLKIHFWQLFPKSSGSDLADTVQNKQGMSLWCLQALWSFEESSGSHEIRRQCGVMWPSLVTESWTASWIPSHCNFGKNENKWLEKYFITDTLKESFC